MIILVTYDIVDDRTRARVHRFLKEFGLNTQKSVFECPVDAEAIGRIREFCHHVLDPEEDSVRIYRICSRCAQQVAVSGLGLVLTRLDYAVV